METGSKQKSYSTLRLRKPEILPFDLRYYDAVLALWQSTEGLTLREQGIFKCHLFVRADNPEARAFWERAGWTVRDDVVFLSRTVSGGKNV